MDMRSGQGNWKLENGTEQESFSEKFGIQSSVNAIVDVYEFQNCSAGKGEQAPARRGLFACHDRPGMTDLLSASAETRRGLRALHP